MLCSAAYLQYFMVLMRNFFQLVVCDYSFHVAVTWWGENVGKEMEVLCKERGGTILLNL